MRGSVGPLGYCSRFSVAVGVAVACGVTCARYARMIQVIWKAMLCRGRVPIAGGRHRSASLQFGSGYKQRYRSWASVVR
jgi:hypothetical protein